MTGSAYSGCGSGSSSVMCDPRSAEASELKRRLHSSSAAVSSRVIVVQLSGIPLSPRLAVPAQAFMRIDPFVGARLFIDASCTRE